VVEGTMDMATMATVMATGTTMAMGTAMATIIMADSIMAIMEMATAITVTEMATGMDKSFACRMITITITMEMEMEMEEAEAEEEEAIKHFTYLSIFYHFLIKNPESIVPYRVDKKFI
jgi:hypothetical protein